MPGANFQLNCIGAQDNFLTKFPTKNFLKEKFEQYVNFARDSLILNFEENVDFGKKLNIEISKLGDYVSGITLQVKLPKLNQDGGGDSTFVGWTNSIGHALINSVSISIGGYQIDKKYGLFMEIWEELSKVSDGYNSLIGKVAHVSVLKFNALTDNDYFIPIKFWFCRGIANALPLFALKYSEVVVSFDLKKFEDCIVYDGNLIPPKVNILEASLLIDYIYIDEDFRLDNSEFEFIIEQTQFVSESFNRGGINSIYLPFNHPVGELIWVVQEKDSLDNNDWFNFSTRDPIVNSTIVPLLNTAKLILDGVERIKSSSGEIFNKLNVYKYHTNFTDKHIYCYPFSLFPEKGSPSGTMNFSRVSQALFQVGLRENVPSTVLSVFANSYNVLKIKDGQTYIGFAS